MSTKNQGIAVILFAHGSAVEEANQGIRELAGRIQVAGSYAYVQAAFLGPGQPEMGAAIAQAVKAGYRRVVVLPYFLTLGIHLRRDLPKLVAEARKKHPQVKIRVGQSLEDHPEMASIILGRIQEVIKEA
ncbi:MAG TPA: CbiX/SirB N-terminal domain-containing protein [Terriglobia bacterium]|nr:CbiX/SirB N-terminal domain-containing protein [Terriglobia bacterium]